MLEHDFPPNDYQATVLHQFGVDHRKLVYTHAGRDQTLLDGRPARVITELI